MSCMKTFIQNLILSVFRASWQDNCRLCRCFFSEMAEFVADGDHVLLCSDAYTHIKPAIITHTKE